MSDQTTSASQPPAIRSFQFDGDGIGAIQNSVNLFRGDVNFTLPLVTLAGRSGLDVAISILLRSNVENEIGRWSLSAPTGILGLGWSLPYDRIEVVTRGSASPEDNSYFLVTSDVRNPLLRSALPWSLFVLPASFVPSLDAGEVTPALRVQFADHGIALSQQVTVEPFDDGTSQGWLLADAGGERVFRILHGAIELPVEDGGLGFETQSYQFWQIRYYPSFERWLLVRENGTSQTYGGSAPSALQWSVRWRSNWQGASTVTEGQERVPNSWNLAATFDPWGNQITYAYERVEQAVGEGGLSYTKACYPAVITDTFGRTATFEYGEKDYVPYDPARPETARAPREFMDPHKAVPDDRPNAFQDRYETRFLERLVVRDSQGRETSTVHFAYEQRNFTDTDPTDPLYGDTIKRTLTGVTESSPAGESLPGFVFDYYTGPGDPHPGALRSITYPQGGIATYVYAARSLPVCAKSLAVPRPTVEPQEAWVPRVWFGSDYALVAWYNTDSRDLQLTVHTWLGFWYPWSTAEMTLKVRLDLATLAVLPRADFFAVTWQSDSEDRTEVLLFHKQINTLGQWARYEEEISFSTLQLALAAGDQFLVLADPAADTLDRFTWDWALRRWERETQPLSAGYCTPDVTRERQYFVTAQSNYYLLFCYDRGGEPGRRHNCLRLYHLDALGRWHPGGTLRPDDIDIAQIGDVDTFFWAPGETFAVATYLTRNISTASDYRLEVFHWDAAYQFTDRFRQALQVQKPISFAANVVKNEFVASGPHLFRYNGREWQSRDLPVHLPPGSRNAFWFAVGDDVALMTENGTGQILAAMGVYDPDTDSLQWQTPPSLLANITDPPPFAKTRYFPTAGADYVTLDESFFFRGSSNDWASVPAAPVYTSPADELVNTTTTQNQAPAFIAYLQVEDVDGELEPLRTRVVNLENGRPGKSEDFPEQISTVYDLQGNPQQNLSGKMPAGPGSLFSWPLADETLDDASSITLRRHIQGTVDGNVVAFPVVQLAIDNGYERNHTRYEYDESTAVCDPTGQVVKFFRAWRFAGDAEGSSRPHGTTEVLYINGLPSDHPPLAELKTRLFLAASPGFDNSEDNFSVLDGFIRRQNAYDQDGVLVSWQQNDWRVEVEIATADGTRMPVRGAYVLNPRVVQMKDGVTTTTVVDYDLSSGQRNRQEMAVYDAFGEPQLKSEVTTYAYQVYPEARARHLLTGVAQTLRQVQNEGQDRRVTAVLANRWKTWPRPVTGAESSILVYDTFDSYTWQGGSGDPDFTAWDPALRPAAVWLRTAAITARSSHGLVVESEDAMARPASNLYDRDERYLVAAFSNARLLGDEADYLGFEEYEQDLGWRLVPSGRPWQPFVVDGQGHTGRRCLRLDADTTGQDGFARTFTPVDQDGHFLFSAWYKGEVGFTPDAQAGWALTVRSGSEILETVQVPFEPTAGRWTYVSRGVDLALFASGGAPLQVTLTAANPTAPAVLLDDLRWSAFIGAFSAKVYETRFDLATATLGPNLETRRALYDDFQRPVGSTGPDENVLQIASRYLSRQAADSFVTDFPNSAVQIQGAGRGFCSDFFRDGDLSHWSTGQPDQWRTADGRLVHEGDADGSIRLAEPAITRRYAAYVLASPAGIPRRPLGLRVGSHLSVVWDPAAESWQLLDDLIAGEPLPISPRRSQPRRGRQPQAASSSATGMQREWLLVVAARTVLFFADGEMIFSYLAGSEVEGELEIFAGDPVSFGDIILAEGVQTSLVYSDAAGNPRQTQSLGPAESIVAATVYDDLGRPAVATKPAALASVPEIPLLAYRPGFVTDLDWVSGVMRGEVSEYYSPGGGGFSDDQGYPYSRKRYEASPVGRVVEMGLPGKDFAITDLAITPPDQRHTMKIAYGTTTGSGFLSWLPAGEYYLTTTTDADRNQSFEVRTKAEVTVGTGSLLDAATGRTLTTVFQTTDQESTQTTVTLLPNYFDPPEPAFKERWKTTAITNLLGRMVTLETPDAGRTEMIYDPLGNLRFRQSAEGRENGYYLYFRYDALNRLLESGSLESAWDRPSLQQIAETDPSWPPTPPSWPPTPPTWEQIQEYDGDGSDALAMSRLVTSTTSRGDGSSTPANRLRYRYSAGGQVVEETLEELPGEEAHPIAYDYDNLGNLTRIRYLAAADGGNAPEVVYGFDELGRLRSVGNGDSEPEAFAVYTYNADGSVAAQLLRPGTAAETLRVLSYNSPGWSTGFDSPQLRQTVFYVRDAEERPGYYNGLPAAESCTFSGAPPGAVTAYSYGYRYDAASRLTRAEATAGGVFQPQWSLGPGDQPVTYDGNGNFLLMPRGGDSLCYAYDGGTDKVKNTRCDDAQDYTYDADGGVTAALPRGITGLTYGRVTRLTRSATVSAGEVRFEYDGQGRRIRKLGGGGDFLYLYGSGDRPLVRRTAGSAGASTTRYVYSLGGLLGFFQDGRFWLVLADRLGSSRALVSDDGAVTATWSYLPFGELLNAAGDEAGRLPYLFTGQELDPELGVYNFLARLYDPALGRFYGTDPQGQFSSPYIYAGNQPTLLVDPSGEIAFLPVLFAMGIGALIGAISGGISYGIQNQGDFETWKFLGYVAVGAGAGALGGALGFGAGAALTSALSLSTTTFTTGLMVGAVVGGVDGLVTGGLTQIGGNLIEGKRGGAAFEGALDASLYGLGLGAATGGLLGSATGAYASRIASKTKQPGRAGMFFLNLSDEDLNAGTVGTSGKFFSDQPAVAVRRSHPERVLRIYDHGNRFGRMASGYNGRTLVQDLRGFRGYGVDLNVCYAARGTVPQELASGLGRPVRASTDVVATYNGVRMNETRGRFVMFFPSRWVTAWVRTFGY